MGRRPSVNVNLPPRMRARVQRSGTIYYYYDTGERPRREIPLGSDYVLAVQKWSSLQIAPAPVAMTVGWAIGKYLQSIDYTRLGAGTQDDYRFALDKLRDKFGDAPLDEVRPSHVVLYIEQRSQESKHRAQRERAILSMIFRWSMARDYCTANPVAPVKGKRLPGRKDIYIHEDMLEAVYQQASQDLKDAIDLAYFIGQRPGDLLSMTAITVRDGWLEYRQGKTGTPQRIQIDGQLEALLQRIELRKSANNVVSLHLLINERGQRMTKAMLRSRFEKARAAAGISGKDFQFRDLRRKSGSDMRDQEGLEAAQDLLGHASITMTEHYTGSARGKQVTRIPLRKRPEPLENSG